MFIRRETREETVQRIMSGLEQCQGLDQRSHGYLHKVYDLAFLTSIPYLVNGCQWAEPMKIVFTNYRVGKYRDGSEWSHWIPVLKAAFGLFGDVKLTSSQMQAVSRGAEVCHRTYEFFIIVPKLISQPTHGIIQLGAGKRGSFAIERFLNASMAWRLRKPVTAYTGEVVPVPDPTRFPPPILPYTGSFLEASELAKKLGPQYGREDALASEVPQRLEFRPEPPDGYRWSDEFNFGWQPYGELYLHDFDATRGGIDGVRCCEMLGHDDALAGRPAKHKIEYVGEARSGTYIQAWETHGNVAYHRAYHDALVPGDPPLDDPPDDPPPIDPDDPLRAQKRETYTALSKAWSYVRIHRQDDANEWGHELIRLVEEYILA